MHLAGIDSRVVADTESSSGTKEESALKKYLPVSFAITSALS
jgi:hypothetical protein